MVAQVQGKHQGAQREVSCSKRSRGRKPHSEDEIKMEDVEEQLGEEGGDDLQQIVALGRRCAHHPLVGGRRKRTRSLDNLGTPLQPLDSDERTTAHVASHGTRQHQEGIRGSKRM